jgi:hypothetical protein
VEICCERGVECEKILGQLSDYQLLSEGSAPWSYVKLAEKEKLEVPKCTVYFIHNQAYYWGDMFQPYRVIFRPLQILHII